MSSEQTKSKLLNGWRTTEQYQVHTGTIRTLVLNRTYLGEEVSCSLKASLVVCLCEGLRMMKPLTAHCCCLKKKQKTKWHAWIPAVRLKRRISILHKQRMCSNLCLMSALKVLFISIYKEKADKFISQTTLKDCVPFAVRSIDCFPDPRRVCTPGTHDGTSLSRIGPICRHICSRWSGAICLVAATCQETVSLLE